MVVKKVRHCSPASPLLNGQRKALTLPVQVLVVAGCEMKGISSCGGGRTQGRWVLAATSPVPGSLCLSGVPGITPKTPAPGAHSLSTSPGPVSLCLSGVPGISSKTRALGAHSLSSLKFSVSVLIVFCKNWQILSISGGVARVYLFIYFLFSKNRTVVFTQSVRLGGFGGGDRDKDKGLLM